jgi:predicted regulator of Ras-like GTPase activity (Roadblock/LC7/MglB family)
MVDKLNALLERLKAHQRTLTLAMAEHDGLPAGSAIRSVAELENVIAAVEAVAAEEAEAANARSRDRG